MCLAVALWCKTRYTNWLVLLKYFVKTNDKKMGKGLSKRKCEKLRKKQNLKSFSKIKKKVLTAKK